MMLFSEKTGNVNKNNAIAVLRIFFELQTQFCKIIMITDR